MRTLQDDLHVSGSSSSPESTALLRELVQRSGGQVLIDPVEEDRYGRTVAEVWSDGVELINSELVGQGMAFVYDRMWGAV
jgi:endonuclease YncB( thermonuclease family)